MYNLTLFSQFLPILLPVVFGWAAWTTKTLIDIIRCGAGTSQKLDDFINEYRNNHK